MLRLASTGAIERVLERTRTRARGPFPTAEIGKVVRDDSGERSVFHGRMDLFLADIAGYSHSAVRLKRWEADALRKAKAFLSQGFFERYPEHAPLRERVNQQNTPLLFEEMDVAELNRLDLLEEVNRILMEEIGEIGGA